MSQPVTPPKDDVSAAKRSGTHEVPPKGERKVSNEEADDAPRDEENLEEGLEDSMDGSDPPSSIQA